MTVLYGILMCFWVLEFYMRKHICLSATIVVAFAYGIWFRISKGNWGILFFSLAVIFVAWSVYRGIIALDMWDNATQKKRHYYAKQKTKEELKVFIDKRMKKTIKFMSKKDKES